MNYSGSQILNSIELQNLLITNKAPVLEVIDNNENITKKLGNYIYISKSDDNLLLTGDLQTQAITPDMTITFVGLELTINSELYHVYTSTEAAKLWDKDESTVRRAIMTGRFIYGVDYRKAGRISLITKDAMIRVFGPPKKLTSTNRKGVK